MKQTLFILLLMIYIFGAKSQCTNFRALSHLQAHNNEDTVCINSTSITLGGNPSYVGGTAPYSYLWTTSHGTLSDNTSASPNLTTFSGFTTVTLTVTDGNGCVAKDTVYVDTNCSPVNSCTNFRALSHLQAHNNEDTVCINSTSITLGGNPSYVGGAAPYSYLWTTSHGTLSDNTSASPNLTTFSGFTTVTLTVTDGNGCVAKDTVYVDTNCNTNTSSIIEINNNFKLKYYPNPVINELTIEIDNENKIISTELYDVLGGLRKQNVLNNKSAILRFDFSQLKKGIYFLKINTQKGSKTLKLFKD